MCNHQSFIRCPLLLHIVDFLLLFFNMSPGVWYLICGLSYLGIIQAASLPATPSLNIDQQSPSNDIFPLVFLNESHTNGSLSAFDPAINGIRCFSDYPESATMQPMIMDDYYEALEQILTYQMAMVPQQLHLHPMPHKRVASHETCKMTVASRVSTPITKPNFQLIFFAHVAALIVKMCMTEERRFLGGNAELWERSVVFAVGNTR